MFNCWFPGIRCKDTAGIPITDHLTVKKRLIAAGKQMSMCQPSGKVTQNTMRPLRQWSHFTLWKDLLPFFHSQWSRKLSILFSQIKLIWAFCVFYKTLTLNIHTFDLHELKTLPTGSAALFILQSNHVPNKLHLLLLGQKPVAKFGRLGEPASKSSFVLARSSSLLRPEHNHKQQL